ncbi:polysaccharide pyruvyl transferase family protein [Falsigemmobacter faecalis]|uniref:Polysaccharide pyruvyl transferase family protein n=1 Tax=Falsigemmobacter faecalis TaxID=2488730 RepID=A0A3P3CYQ4_9RHOB|nr:polysaccharide pyruvyl transferase family protein [Falsigemmobacter faecalis]RRH67309.1 polysaccharide pyruvyl transferase family protein [Falsigemmobacter faecalis]
MTPIERQKILNVGILTLPLHTNFGGILQAVALYNFLSGEGHNVTLIRAAAPRPLHLRLLSRALRNTPFQNFFGIRGNFLLLESHTPFLRRYIATQTRRLRGFYELRNFVQGSNLDAVIVGSDQVWRPEYGMGVDIRRYFLDFADEPVLKVSYAASFGLSRWNYQDYIPELTNLLLKFNAISLREGSGVKICCDTFGRDDGQVVLDPTLLMPASFYEQMLPRDEEVPQKKLTVLKYVLDAIDACNIVEKEIVQSLGADVIVTSIAAGNNSTVLTVPEWLSKFKTADYVITDSYHGMIFSIIFQKQFIVVPNMCRGGDRFMSLARMLFLESRVHFDGQDFQLPAKEIDYEHTHSLISDLRHKSVAFIRKSLFNRVLK